MNFQKSQGDKSPNINGENISVTYVSQGIKAEISSEVKTIQYLIGLLTNLAKKEADKTHRGEIDPQKKFNRFSEYADRMKSLFTELTIKYGGHYDLVMTDLQPSRTDLEDINSYLRNTSVVALERTKGNPLISLDDMCKNLEAQFFADGEEKFEYDNGAVRFFLYKQLVECNIFPNLND